MVILFCDATAARAKKLNETQRDTGRPLTTTKEIAKVIDQIEKVGAQVADASCPVEKFATFKGIRAFGGLRKNSCKM